MKVIVCDLDGTLIGADHQIDENSLAKIQKFCAEGNLFIVATGRLDADITYVEERLGQTGLYRISQNGSVIRNKENETIFKRTIPKETVDQLADVLFATEMRVEVNTETNRHFPAPRPGNEVGEFIDSSIVIENLKTHTKTKLTPTIFLMFGTEQQFQPIIRHIQTHHADQVVALMTSPTSLEVFNKEASKGNAVEFVMSELGITASDVYVVGDSENDISMFKTARNSFCMTHSKDHVKKMATHTVRSVGEVVDYIEKESKR